MLVYDPINLENIPINDYLNNDANNVVIILNNKAYGINKALLMFNNEMKRCIISNNALLKKATYYNPEIFYNIGYFIGKKVIVNLKNLNKVLKKNRIMELTSKTTGDTYINKELLELSTIGIIKMSKNSIGKVNFKQTHANTCNDNEKILFLMKTLEPDIYNIYETENVNDKSIGIALVQTMNDSKILRTAFRDKNAMTVLKFACTFSDKFKKWKAERQILIS